MSPWQAGATVALPGSHHAWPDEQPTPDIQPIGGLRQLKKTMSRLPQVGSVGTQIYLDLQTMFQQDDQLVEQVLAHVGRADCTALAPDLSERFRSSIAATLSRITPPPPAVASTEDCPVDTELLSHWCEAAKEPDMEPLRWLRHGAPAGILNPILDRGIFPTYDPTVDVADLAAEELASDSAFVNYSGTEQDNEVASELDRQVRAGYAISFDTLEECEAYLKASPVLSKIGVIRRMRNGKLKIRMVVDSKQSGVSRATRKFERTLLPRALDVVLDAMDLMQSSSSQGTTLQFMVADFRDAFFILPNSPSERRFFCVRFRGKFIVFTKTTQGSRGAPLTWARFAALIARLTQSVTGVEETRISTYVDDPIVIAAGSHKQQRAYFAMVLGIWSALRIPVAFDKAVIGSPITWTSAVFSPSATSLTVSVKQSLVEETLQLLTEFITGNYIRKAKMRSCVGKAQHIASLVPMVRPFLSELYAALHSAPPAAHKRFGSEIVWTKQVRPALIWLIHLLNESECQLERTFELMHSSAEAWRWKSASTPHHGAWAAS